MWVVSEQDCQYIISISQQKKHYTSNANCSDILFSHPQQLKFFSTNEHRTPQVTLLLHSTHSSHPPLHLPWHVNWTLVGKSLQLGANAGQCCCNDTHQAEQHIINSWDNSHDIHPHSNTHTEHKWNHETLVEQPVTFENLKSSWKNNNNKCFSC